MISRPAFITKKIACPGCGAENRVRFEQFEMMLELPCSSCAADIAARATPRRLRKSAGSFWSISGRRTRVTGRKEGEKS
jgi:hypothetical protein